MWRVVGPVDLGADEGADLDDDVIVEAVIALFFTSKLFSETQEDTVGWKYGSVLCPSVSCCLGLKTTARDLLVRELGFQKET